MKIAILSWLGRVMGVSFKVAGVPYGAADRREIEGCP
jgi:hypothetical protein